MHSNFDVFESINAVSLYGMCVHVLFLLLFLIHIYTVYCSHACRFDVAAAHHLYKIANEITIVVKLWISASDESCIDSIYSMRMKKKTKAHNVVNGRAWCGFFFPYFLSLLYWNTIVRCLHYDRRHFIANSKKVSTWKYSFHHM